MYTNTTSVTFEVNGQSFTAERRENTKPWSKDGKKKARAYVWGAVEPSKKPIEDQAVELGLDNIHTSKGDHPAMDKAWNKFNRVIVKNQRQVLAAALAAFELEASKISFSRYAGCGSCPCSPGFILDGLGLGVEFFINAVEADEPTASYITG